MDVALHIRDFMDDPSRPMHQQIEEAAEIARHAGSWGFKGIYCPQHWVSYPTIWPQPIPILARLAAEAKGIKLITGVILLPLQNPVELAEQAITMDHITNGHFVLGLGLGYRQTELEAVGTNRAERVGRFEESLKLMKMLWSGETISFKGQYWQVTDARVAITPVQKPHPPVWIAAQSRRAVRRAATMGDGALLGPQPSWDDIQLLSKVYWEAREEQGETSGLLGSNRSIAIARDRETAIRDAEATAARKAGMYGNWDMQERDTVNLGLSDKRDLKEWAIVGSPEECVETVSKSHNEHRLGYVGLGFLNLPKEHSARLEYLHMISEQFISRLPSD